MFVAAILRFPKGRHYLEWNPSWLHHNPFRATLPTSLLISQSWRNRGVNQTKNFSRSLGTKLIKGFSTPKFVSSVALLKYLFLSMRVSFLLSFTMIRSVLFLFLQGFNYLITYPQGNYFHLLNTVLQLFQLFGNWNWIELKTLFIHGILSLQSGILKSRAL